VHTNNHLQVLPNAGHAILSDPQVDVLQLMREEGFLINKRVFTSPLKPGQREGFGQPGPVEMPTKQVRACVCVQERHRAQQGPLCCT